MRRGLVAGIVLLLAATALALWRTAPPEPGAQRPVAFSVPSGEPLGRTAARLHDHRIIRSPRAFTALARVRGLDRDIRAGSYELLRREWAWTILERLARGEVRDSTLTVPEGLWLREIATLVAPLVEGGADSFLAAARDSAFLARLDVPAATAEGYLHPDTYRLPPGGSARRLVERMIASGRDLWRERLAARAESLGVDRHLAATLASIVEAEAQLPGERSRIAAVYWNRLRQGMALQADPTVIYALGKRVPRVYLADLEVPSPYNTYRVAGPPPGPIGNAGVAAWEAVLWPLEGCDDLYFVAAGDGSHVFAPDFETHLRNRRLVERRAREHEP
jgi:UPF0755 protein